jgi:hypothetical protein
LDDADICLAAQDSSAAAAGRMKTQPQNPRGFLDPRAQSRKT